MRLIDADELKEQFAWSEVCRLSITEINKIIDSAQTVDLDERDNDAFETGYIKGLCENSHSDKWYDHVDDNLLKARHGKHVIYNVDFLLDNLAREINIMETVRQMRDKEI